MDKNIEEVAIDFAKYLMGFELTITRVGRIKNKESEESENIEDIKRVSLDYQLMLGNLITNGTELFKDYINKKN